MKLAWKLHPKHTNVHVTTSAAYQYRLQEWNDGRAELTVQHLGDRPNGKPVKRFVYRNRNGAFGGAQRFEDQHGYRDPAHHSPAEIVPFLPELPVQIVVVIRSAQEDAQAARGTVDRGDAPEALFEQQYATYERICAAVLCCQTYDCYVRTEIDNPQCATHRENRED
jgi:hypothetical protein